MQLIDNIFQKNAFKIIGIFLLLFFVSDFATNYLKYYTEDSFIRYSAVVKLGFELFLFIFFLFFRIKKITIYLTLIIGFFVIGQFFVFRGEESFLQNITAGDYYRINKYIYIFFFVNYFEQLKDQKIIVSKLIEFLRIFLLINGLIMMIALIFGTEVLKSYPFTPRFGVDGIFSKSGEATFLYMLWICIEYVNYRNHKKKLFLILSIVFSLLLGLKTIVLFLFLLVAAHICLPPKTRKRNISILVLFLILGLVFRHQIMLFFIEIFPFWKSFYEERGLITVLTSKRDVLLVRSYEYVLENWNFVNYLFGGMNDYRMMKVEFEIVDLFLFFGLSGIITYYYFIKDYFWRQQKSEIKTLLIVVLLALNVLGGALLSVTGMICFYLSFKYFLTNSYINE